MASSKDYLDTYFDHGFDPRRRRIFLHGDITEESVGELIKGLKILESTNASPIEVWLSSYGGEAYDMFAAFDVLRDCKSHIVMVANGKIMSAGTLILSAGDERRCYSHTLFMVHELAYDSPYQKTTTHENEVKHAIQMMEQYYECLASRTKKSAKQWRQLIKGKSEKYFTAEQALSYGLVDDIIEVD